MQNDPLSISKFRELVELKDYKPPTKKEYVRCVRRLGDHAGCDPAVLTEDQVRAYFLFLRQEKEFSGSAMSIVKAALQLFYREQVGQREWRVFGELIIRRGQTLPLVLGREEVHRILETVREERFRVCLGLIYHCGLRVGEAVRIQVKDIDGKNLRLMVRQGKGGKDRCVPMALEMVEELRRFWKTHGNREWLFPSPGRAWRERGVDERRVLKEAKSGMSVSAVQNAFRLARAECGVNARATVHTLRHCYATHLLEEGVSLRLISQYLGHASLDVTVIYTHLTATNESQARAALGRLWAGGKAPEGKDRREGAC